MSGKPPLILHVIEHLIMGGLEQVLVELINRMPPDRFRHAVVCLDRASDFRARIQDPDIPIHVLGKRPGKDLGVYLKFWKLLGALKPDIVHSCNLAALEYQALAAMRGVAGRVHAEHGRDLSDLDGSNLKYLRHRHFFYRFCHGIVPVSHDLYHWLRERLGQPEEKVFFIGNGIDTDRFTPHSPPLRTAFPEGFRDPDLFVIGAVGRLQGVKDHATLLQAFARLPGERNRLVLVGDGPLRGNLEVLAEALGIRARVWFAGSREDAPTLLAGLDLFALSSLAEGTPLTVLEAMAAGLPVVATGVGGLPEVVVEGETGFLVPPADPDALAAALARYADSSEMRRVHGTAARGRATGSYGVEAMVTRYLTLFDAVTP